MNENNQWSTLEKQQFEAALAKLAEYAHIVLEIEPENHKARNISAEQIKGLTQCSELTAQRLRKTLDTIAEIKFEVIENYEEN